jgi:hypothetical protein
MTEPAGRRAPTVLAEGWRIEIPMPVHGPDAPSRLRGKPVGWLSLNKLAGGVRAAQDRWWVKKAWRLAACLAYQRHRLPRGLPRIYIEVEFRFSDRTRRDPSNLELTVKPIVDALQPERSGIRYNPAKKRREPFVDKGWGVIPGDDPRYVVRGAEMEIGEPLGRTNPIKGMVILHIKPLPP